MSDVIPFTAEKYSSVRGQGCVDIPHILYLFINQCILGLGLSIAGLFVKAAINIEVQFPSISIFVSFG